MSLFSYNYTVLQKAGDIGSAIALGNSGGRDRPRLICKLYHSSTESVGNELPSTAEAIELQENWTTPGKLPARQARLRPDIGRQSPIQPRGRYGDLYSFTGQQ